MKKFIVVFSALGFLITTAFSGGESCNGNDFFIQGVKSKMGYYSANGTQTGFANSEVTKVYSSGDSTISVLIQNYTDLKLSKVIPSEMKFICLNGIFMMDISGTMTTAKLELISAGNMVGYKQSYTVGEKLDSVNCNMGLYANDKLITTSNYCIYNRIVESFDDLSTEAGIFKCYKISSMLTGDMRLHEHGRKVISNKPSSKSVIYYCPQIGILRVEDYDTDNKLSTYSQLLELTKP